MKNKKKICVVTGATRGIGRATAHMLAARGDQVILACRDVITGQVVRNEIVSATGNNDVDVIFLDLESLKSIKQFCDALHSRLERIDVLINNAGVFRTSLEFTADGLEKVFAVNYVGPFYLTNLLCNLLEKTPGATVINVASNMHRIGTFHFDDFSLGSGYDGIKAYAQSKLCLISFTKEMAKRHSDIICNCYHPGPVRTEIGNIHASGFYKHGWNFIKTFFISPRKGAETAIYLADGENLKGVSGQYFYKMKSVTPTSRAVRSDNTERLWTETERIISRIIGKNDTNYKLVEKQSFSSFRDDL